MKNKLALICAALLAAMVAPKPNAEAVSFSISVGDRPYYYGPSYWDNGYRWVWIPGYYHHHHWVHGYYARRGRWHAVHAYEHHYHHHD
jgi:hypothetical protein